MTVKSLLAASTILVMAASTAQAGGLDRSRLPYAALFESGRYMELGFSNVRPDVSGTYPALVGGGSTGDMANDYTTLSFAYKADVNEKLAYALFINTPYGADAAYGQGFYNGLQAEWKSQQIAAVLKYKATDNVSVYGGLRYLQSEATIRLPAQIFGPTNAPLTGTYTAAGDRNGKVGYIIGAAYEMPEIALRVGLTYESGVTHDFATAELFSGPAPDGNTTTEIEIPDSVTLDFQTGIAEGTLLFGSLKWSEWSKWSVSPPIYQAVIPGTANDVITDFDNDVLTWQLGVGRRINENLSVFARATYEKANGGVASRLAPTDGTKGLGIGAIWRQDNMKVTGGIEYAKVGDAIDSVGTRFEGNSAVGAGVTVGFSF